MTEIRKKRASILALANQKGGCGKTVSTVNLACAFAQLGKKVLVVDGDYQGNASSQLGLKQQAEDLEKTITEGLLGEKSADTIWLKTKFDNVFAVCANQDFSEFNLVYMQPGAHGLLRDWLETARPEFDIIIIDTHPSLDLTFQNVMVAADYYILPLFAEPESVEGLHVMFKHVKKIKDKLNSSLHILGCFVTRYDKTIKTHERFLETIKGFGTQIGMPMLGVIPVSKAVPTSSETKVPIVASGQKYPIVDAYMELANRLLPQLKPSRRGRSPNTPEVDKKDVRKFISQFEIESTQFTPLVVDKGASI